MQKEFSRHRHGLKLELKKLVLKSVEEILV